MTSNHIPEDIKAVFLDHDDTLVGTIEAKWAHHKHVAKKFYGRELTDDDIRPHWGKPLGELVCLLYGTDDGTQAMAHNTATHEAYPKVLFPGTIPTLRRIRAAGLVTGIVTATSSFSFEHDLELHGIPRELVDYTQTEEDTLFHKPDPRVFDPALAWLEGQSISPSEVLYIGDGLHDMKAATGAGFNFLGVETGLVTADNFRQNNIKSIPNIAALYAV
ncbi:MAG TPA: HAD hydrolase-like protein [Candidatus Saccharimonadales bacterium]|nr:HAD hydrolase-like protein [Candidatus Saccharimonadales bacterium]